MATLTHSRPAWTSPVRPPTMAPLKNKGSLECSEPAMLTQGASSAPSRSIAVFA
jgi:hypothetical protein